MRLFMVSAAALAITAAIWGATGRTEADSDPAGSSPATQDPTIPVALGLIVHEWGTFTSFSGSDGVRLEFRPLADEDLPPFVLDRFLQSGHFHPFSKSQVRVRMRMETPITYFYTDRERDVNVRVRFPEGLLTEFYPPVARMEPTFEFGPQLHLKQSSLDWGSVHLIPTDRLQAQVEDPALRRLLESLLPIGLTPPSDPKFHYGHARETDSALVHVHRPKPDPVAFDLRPAGDFFEKFLFYRGIGNFDLPLQLTAAGDGGFELTNSGDDPVRSLFLVDTDGATVRFTEFAEVAGGRKATLVNSRASSTIDTLADAVTKALVREGLYEKESLAMVNTWRSSWFGEPGTRLLYIVPRTITDSLLPLEVSPRPETTVRVLVGRMEIMTPEQESQVIALVRKSAAERQAEIEAAAPEGREPKYAGPAELGQLGRLAEPALVRVQAISKDPALRAEARLLLTQLTGRR